MLALDSKVPDQIWMELIAWDICTYRLQTPAGTFTIELLSDTEFLLFQCPQSGRGMTWKNTIQDIQNLHGVTDCGGTRVTIVSGQRIMKQSKIDPANMQKYHLTHTLEWTATTKGILWAVAIDKNKPPVPQSRGWGYTYQADHYFAQKFARAAAPEPTLHAIRPASPENYHSARGLRNLSTRVRVQRIWTLTPQQLPIMMQITPSIATPRTVTINARIRSTVTGQNTMRPMPRSRKTGGVAGW